MTGIYDWVRKAFSERLPPLPPPFSWISEWVDEHVWKRLRRTFSEIQLALSYLISEIMRLWEKRNHYFYRLRMKFGEVLNQARAYVDTQKALIQKGFNDWIEGTFKVVQRNIDNQIRWMWEWADSLNKTLSNHIYTTFANFRTAVESFVASTTARLNELKPFSTTIMTYWISTYNLYRTQLTSFLSNPSEFIMSLVESKVSVLRSRIVKLATDILTAIW